MAWLEVADMVSYDCFPKKECMKLRFKQKYYRDYFEPPQFKSDNPKSNGTYYFIKGRKLHSHNWGRKPYWRKKRKEQRRAKALLISI